MGSNKKYRILVAPLDWGLGHATRCIPIIHYLLEKNVEVVIAADKRPLELLKKEFPSLEFAVLPGYRIAYPNKGSMILKMFLSIPKIVREIREEHELLKKIIRERKIDAVISDNRFGLWSKDIPCVYLTHQVMVKSPFGEKWLYRRHKKIMEKFMESWIPDLSGDDNLSGDLSHKCPLPENACFIGPLTRFKKSPLPPFERGMEEQYDLIAVLSGPEPQRSIFEEKIIDQLRSKDIRVLIVRGITEADEEIQVTEKIKTISHLSLEKLQSAIQASKIVLSRSGYSTIMDLSAIGAKAIFVPTPGQTEQEYLSEFFKKKGIAFSMPQKDLDIGIALKESEKYSGFVKMKSEDLYKECVGRFLEKIV